MNVLHIIPSISPKRGGPSFAVKSMCAALNNQGITATIATTDDDGDECFNLNQVPSTLEGDTRVHYFAKNGFGTRSLREFSASMSFNRWLRNHIEDFDVLHIHAIFSGITSYAMWLARRRGKPYIVRTIGQLEPWSLQQSALRKTLFLRLFEHQSLRRAAAIHCTSQAELESVKAFDATLKSTVVRLGVNDLANGETLETVRQTSRRRLEEQLSIANDTKRVLYLSRIHPKKRIEDLIHAFALLLDTHESQNVVLLIAGNGEAGYLAHLRELAKTLKIENAVHFLGFAEGEQKRTLLFGCDLFCLPSANENFGIAVAESLSAGCPVIISSEVALAEWVQQHHAGYVLPTIDQPELLARYLDEELTSSSLYQHGERIRSSALNEFSWKRCADELADLYQSIT